MLVWCTYRINNYLYICLVDVFVQRPKPCNLIPYPLYLSLSPTNKYLNSNQKKSDPTSPATIYTPFHSKEKKKEYNSLFLEINNTNQPVPDQKKKQVDAGIFLCVINRTRCPENYLARNRAAASACLLLPFSSELLHLLLQEVWYGMVWYLSVNCSNFIHSSIHSFTHPALSFPHGHNIQMPYRSSRRDRRRRGVISNLPSVRRVKTRHNWRLVTLPSQLIISRGVPR